MAVSEETFTVVSYTIEPMRESDWPQVQAIYLEAIATGQKPWR